MSFFVCLLLPIYPVGPIAFVLWTKRFCQQIKRKLAEHWTIGHKNGFNTSAVVAVALMYFLNRRQDEEANISFVQLYMCLFPCMRSFTISIEYSSVLVLVSIFYLLIARYLCGPVMQLFLRLSAEYSSHTYQWRN